MKPQVLLIGSSGFIGQHLNLCLCDSYDIWHVNRHAVHTGQTVIADLLEPHSSDSLREKLNGTHFEAILYLTNISNRNVPEGFSVEEANIQALSNLLDGLTIRADKFGFFSSVYVYKNPEINQKISENSPVEPNSPYGKLKATMEDQVLSWGINQGIPISIFRPEWVYGPGDKTKKMIPELCRAAVSSQPYQVKVNPQEIRQPIFISDLVTSISHWMTLKTTGMKEVYLLVGPKPANQLALYNIARQNSALSGNPVVEFTSISNQSLNYSFDDTLTRHKLNWEPQISPETGMKALIEYLRDDKSQ